MWERVRIRLKGTSGTTFRRPLVMIVRYVVCEAWWSKCKAEYASIFWRVVHLAKDTLAPNGASALSCRTVVEVAQSAARDRFVRIYIVQRRGFPVHRALKTFLCRLLIETRYLRSSGGLAQSAGLS